MKNKLYYLMLGAGMVLIVFSMVRDRQGSLDITDLGIDSDQEQETVKDEQVAGKNYLEGVLYKSEDQGRGNLKLSSNEGDIYLRTSRDFSALIGFQVLVFVNGTKDNFELIDIQSKVAKDGFLLNQ